MNLRLVLAIEGMLMRAALREFGLPPVFAVIAGLLILFADVHAAFARPVLTLSEPVPASLAASFAGALLASIAGACLLSPLLRVVRPTTATERAVHALAALDPRTSLAATMLRRLRALIVPCALLAAAGGLTPLDPSVAWGLIVVFVAASLAAAGGAVVLSLLAHAAGRRAAAAVTCGMAAALVIWAGFAFPLSVPLIVVPLMALVGSLGIAALALVAPNSVAEDSSGEKHATAVRHGNRLPSFSGGLAPIALIIALRRARPFGYVAWLLIAVVAGIAMNWACRNAGSDAGLARVTLVGVLFPTLIAAFDAAATTRHLAQPLWWLQAKNVDAAVRGTILGTSLGQFALCGVLAMVAVCAGAPLALALAAAALGFGAIVIARSIATIARRRLRRAGITGGSGLMEFLEALTASPFVIASSATALVFAASPWVFAAVLLAPAGAIVACSALSQSVRNEGPGRA